LRHGLLREPATGVSFPRSGPSRRLIGPAHQSEDPIDPANKKARRSLRLHGTIARQLGILIVSGRYPPGHLLGGEISSADKLSVSRTAYREAVRILAAKGLVNAKPKVGTRVNPRSMWQLLDPDVLDWAFESEPDLTMLDSLFELRNVVESAAAAFAAQRRTTTQLRLMRAALKAMETHTLATEEGRQADADFHTTLLLATGNPFIISLTNGVRAAIRTTTIYKQRHQPLRRDPLPDHIRVFDAIAAKEPKKAQIAMSELIQLARIDTPTSRRASRKPP
jgi:DNA-binding FadR family transcriptional regulator